jgi:hypothetical protein
LADNNTVLSVTGVQGNAADFTPANTEYLSITDASQTGMEPTGDFSISAWVNIDSVPGSEIEIISKTNTASQRSFNFGILGSGDGYGLKLFISGNGATTTRVQGTSSAAIVGTGDVGKWRHLVAVYNEAAATVTMYKSGSSVGVTMNNAGTVTSVFNSSSPVIIGGLGTTGTPTALFDGSIDEVGFWSKALTSTEVTDLYNAGAGLPYLSTGATFTPRVSFII